jgi:metacaspase-1
MSIISNKKLALCVGINDYPGTSNDLRGCVNDANAWAQMLTQNFAFNSNDVKILLNSDATKQNILDNLRNLISSANSGDILVYTNSSHGTYVADYSGDEEYDEAVCAYDENILDDEYRAVFKQIPEGVKLTVIFDNCHSGSGTRDVLNFENKARFMDPAERGFPILSDVWSSKPKSVDADESLMKEVLLSGCRADQVSWDVKIGNSFHGAMTFCAIEAIKAANYQITYSKLHSELQKLLDNKGYDQNPQLEGHDLNKSRQIFS